MMNDFPRSRNGWVDDGEHLKGAAQNQPCYNCGSNRYYQTVSTEHCPACVLRVDYWGNGTNEVYLAWEKRKAEKEKRRAEKAEWDRQYDEAQELYRWENEHNI
jgi:hypothetical protein